MTRTITLILLLLVLLPLAVRANAPTRNLAFIENRGQWNARARYAAHLAPGARVFAEAGGLTYTLSAGLPEHRRPHDLRAPAQPGNLLPIHGLRVEFVGADPGAALLPEQPAPDRTHFLLGNDPARWGTDARAWGQLRYRQLWPGTDMVLHENAARQLEYDLLLAPGADPSVLRFNYRGADALSLDPATGNLRVRTAAGILTEQHPQAWQLDPATGQRQPVACAFRLRGTELSFALGRYDHRRALTIDPVVQFASYTGSTSENWGFASTYDAAGNLYTAGVVFEPGYPVTTGAYQTTFAGNIDIAVMKFLAGTSGPAARAWATYIGGNNAEFPHSLQVNSRGELLLLGSTSSTTYPTTPSALGRTFKGGPSITPYGNALPITLLGGVDLVLSRLSADGRRLRASTYLGGTGTDGLTDPLATNSQLAYNHGDPFRGDLALDAQGNVYVASTTGSVDFPGLNGSYRGGPTDGLVTSLDSSFSQVRWTTPVGGTAADAAYSLFREDAGGLLVAGGTMSANLGGAAGGYQATLSGGVDGFVARLTSGGALVQATYLGTAQYDQAYFVRRGGPEDKVYVFGQTLSNTWPNLNLIGRYGNPFGHQFIQQLAPDLLTAGFSTKFGSGRPTIDLSPTAFDVDCYGRIMLAGWGGGIDPHNGSTYGLSITPNALQASTDGEDFYLMQLSDEARVLEYATYFGSSADDHVDGGMSRFTPQGTLFQAVCACNQGPGIPIPPGANTYSAANGSLHCNNAAFKFAMLANTSGAGVDTLSVCARSGPIKLGGSPAGGTWAGTGVTGSVGAGYVFTPDTLRLGASVLTYTSPLTGLCAGTSTRTITVLPQALARLKASEDTVCLQPQGPAPAPVTLTGQPAGGTFSGVGVVLIPGGAVFNPVIAGPGSHLIVYTLAGGRCPAVAVTRIVVEGRRSLEAGPPVTYCENDPAVSLSGIPPGGVWTGPGVTGDTVKGYQFTPFLAGVGRHFLLYSFPAGATTRCKPPTDTLKVIVRAAGATAIVPADTALCATAAAFRLRSGIPAGGIWSGPGVTGTLATGFYFTPSAALIGTQAIIYTVPSPDTTACPARAARSVSVKTDSVKLVVAHPTVCVSEGPQLLQATPAGGVWTGPGVTGSAAAGYYFTPSQALLGKQLLTYTSAAPTTPGLCPATGQVAITVMPPPPVMFEPVAPVNYCVGVPPHGVVLYASPTGGAFSGPGVSGNRFNPALAGPGTHTITYTISFKDLLGIDCPVTLTQPVSVTLLPPISLPADTVLCFSRTPFRLRASPPGGTWSGPNVTPLGVFTPPTTPGTSVLTYSLPEGCGSQDYRVTVPPSFSPLARWTATACGDNEYAPRTVRFEATGPTAAQVSWDFGDGSAPETGASVEHQYLTAGQFRPLASVPGAGTGPCQSNVMLPSVSVRASFLPNIITPDGDGKNDTFMPRMGGCPAHLQVFSRWGRKVFDRRDYDNQWNGGDLPAGLYYYLLRAPDGAIQAKGWVEIVR